MNEHGAFFCVVPVKGTYSHYLLGVCLLWVWGSVKTGKLESPGALSTDPRQVGISLRSTTPGKWGRGGGQRRGGRRGAGCEYDAHGKAAIRNTQYEIRDTSLYGNGHLFVG